MREGVILLVATRFHLVEQASWKLASTRERVLETRLHKGVARYSLFLDTRKTSSSVVMPRIAF